MGYYQTKSVLVNKPVENIEAILKKTLPKEKKRTSERAELIKELYALYQSPRQKNHRKKANWKRYCAWCKTQKNADSENARKAFKKSKQYLREQRINTFCFFLSPIPTKDIYYLLSVAKDMENRNQDLSSYLMGNLMQKNT